jgi:lipopolysaccharide transport system ATP-binding protein
MSSEVALRLDNLGKCYHIYDQPKDRLKQMLWRGRRNFCREFWALRGISLEVRRGETVGIVGRNGSGKSTLLQLVCRIVTPTEGLVHVSGRISALLELGSGFNPEFTGRENVYLNGSVLGLTPAEVDERFERIAGFADIGDFLDQPVKTYSSGMVLRLAFAVAINVDPSMLIVDETLSVGDEAFQRKCFARIHQIQEAGGTILFVSHSAAAVAELCTRAVLLDRGEMLLQDTPKNVLGNYHKLIYAPPEKLEALRRDIRTRSADVAETPVELVVTTSLELRDDAGPVEFYDPNMVPKSTFHYLPRGAEIRRPKLSTLDGLPVNVLKRGCEYLYSYEIWFAEPAFAVRCGIMIKTVSGLELGGLQSHSPAEAIAYVSAGSVWQVCFRFRCALVAGTYFLNSGVMGMVGDQYTYLARTLDIAMFKVMEEESVRTAGPIDFTPTGGPVVTLTDHEASHPEGDTAPCV